MNRVLKSIASIGMVAAIGLVGSYAFFSDTETSTGNFFQAGAVDLKIDSECHYYEYVGGEQGNHPFLPGYLEKECLDEEGNEFGTWASTDLTQERFYAFHDVKPGDFGENTISVTVEDNDAWACMYIENAEDNDNTQTEPEAQVDPDGLASGELAENLHFTAWLDQGITPGWQGKPVYDDNNQLVSGDKGEGDNLWQGRNSEPLLFSNISGPASDVLDGQMYPLADSQTGPGPLEGGVTHYYGVAWCAGELSLGGQGQGNLIYCDGEPMGNEAQTDSFSADVRFYVEQSRNNPDFVCPQPEPNPEPSPDITVGANLQAYEPPSPQECDITVPSQDISTIQDGVDAAFTGDTVCVDEGVYNEDVLIDKGITLLGDGAVSTSTINGQSTGYVGAIQIPNGAGNITIEGFEINGAGQAALYLVQDNANVEVRYSKLTAPEGDNVILTGGGQANHTFEHNVLVGNNSSQLAYVNGQASLGNSSSNVYFYNNTFEGTLGGNLVLGLEASNAEVDYNNFDITGSYAVLESWGTNSFFRYNNLLSGGPIINQDATTLDATNTWWGDTDPTDQVTGNIDYSPSAASAHPTY